MLLATVFFSFNACDEDNKPSKNSTSSVISPNGKISGTLNRFYWDTSFNIAWDGVATEAKRVAVYYNGWAFSDPIPNENYRVTNGYFSFMMPEPPFEEFKSVCESFYYDITEDFISDRNAQIVHAIMAVVVEENPHTKILELTSSDKRSIIVDIVYADRAVSITGKTEKTEYDIHLNKGWNTWIEYREHFQNDEFAPYKVTTNNDAGLIWGMQIDRPY